MSSHDESVAGTDVCLHNVAEYGVQVQHFRQMFRWPGTQQNSAGADGGGRETRCTGAHRRVKSEAVEPETIASAAEAVTLGGVE